MANNDFIAWAVGAGANVESQASFASDPAVQAGETTGKASSARANKLWRQASMWSQAWGQVLNSFGVSANDDGNPSNLEAGILSALQQLVVGLGAGVLPTTGDVKLTIKSVADPGWIIMNDGTIGNASSNATTLANATTSALFTLLWNRTTNSQCQLLSSAGTPVSRGASATADYAANCQLTLPAVLGRALCVAGAGLGLTARTLCSVFGEENHIMITSEMPVHSHSLNPSATGISVNAPTTSYEGFLAGAGSTGFTTFSSNSAFGQIAINPPSINDPTHTHVMGNAGGGNGHNTMQPSSFFNVMIKL